MVAARTKSPEVDRTVRSDLPFAAVSEEVSRLVAAARRRPARRAQRLYEYLSQQERPAELREPCGGPRRASGHPGQPRRRSPSRPRRVLQLAQRTSFMKAGRGVEEVNASPASTAGASGPRARAAFRRARPAASPPSRHSSRRPRRPPRLARDGGRAFVSRRCARTWSPRCPTTSTIARAGRPALVVAGDDRQARDLAADLRAWLAPRPVRFYPSRGVAYESHLAPPPHLVGLRVAALDALLDRRRDEPPVRRGLRRRAEREGPRPRAAPAGFAIARASCRPRRGRRPLVAAGYERVDQVEDRGQFAIRGGILDVYPATEERAVRIELFGDEVESLR